MATYVGIYFGEGVQSFVIGDNFYFKENAFTAGSDYPYYTFTVTSDITLTDDYSVYTSQGYRGLYAKDMSSGNEWIMYNKVGNSVDPTITYTGSNRKILLYSAIDTSSYSVIYYVDGHKWSSATNLSFNSSYTITNAIPSKPGYVFMGWSEGIQSDTPSSYYNPGNTIWILENVRLFSVFVLEDDPGESLIFTVVYNRNNGPSVVPSFQSNPYDIQVINSIGGDSNHELLGWSRYQYDTTPDYVNGDTITIDGEFVELFAVWRVHYTISYNANGGYNAPNAQDKNKGVNVRLSSVYPIRTGYTFKGWSENPSAVSATWGPGATFTGDRDILLYAVWQTESIPFSLYLNNITTCSIYVNGVFKSSVVTNKSWVDVGSFDYGSTIKINVVAIHQGYEYPLRLLSYTSGVITNDVSFNENDSIEFILNNNTKYIELRMTKMLVPSFVWKGSDSNDDSYFMSEKSVKEAITASAWNTMQNIIEIIHNNTSSSSIYIPIVHSGDQIKASLFNTIRSYIMGLSNYNIDSEMHYHMIVDTQISNIDKLYPGLFNGYYDGKMSLKTALNNAIYWYNKN